MSDVAPADGVSCHGLGRWAPLDAEERFWGEVIAHQEHRCAEPVATVLHRWAYYRTWSEPWKSWTWPLCAYHYATSKIGRDHAWALARQAGGPTQQAVKRHPKQDGSAYLIRGAGRIKIGQSSNPTARLRDLQVGSPVVLALVAVLPPPYTESDLHLRFRAYRSHGEWFEETGELKKFIAEHAGTPSRS